MTSASEVLNTRTGVGAGIGAVIGFAFGGPIGAGAGALLGGTIAHASGEPEPKGEITPKRKMLYARAMEKVTDPASLEKLADAFQGEGLESHAEMLRKRAALRKLAPEVQAKRRAAFRKAMASDNPDAIAKLADTFERVGSIDAAKVLREHAEAVRAAHAAGKSAAPMTGGTVAQFADKLGKAIIHFGPASAAAKAAARNLIQARGKVPSDALIGEVIRIAANALNIQAPGADAAQPAAQQGQPPQQRPQQQQQRPAQQPAQRPAPAAQAAPPSPSTVAQAAAAAAEADPHGAPEPTVMGPPAAPVEKPAVAGGIPVSPAAVAAATVEDVVDAGNAAEEDLTAEAEVAAQDAPPPPTAAEIAASADEAGQPAEMAEVIPPPDLAVPSIPAYNAGEEELR